MTNHESTYLEGTLPKMTTSTHDLPIPKALLLDFGGVLVTSRRPDNWQRIVAETIVTLLDGHPQTPTVERITADVAAGALAAKSWRNAMSRPFAPAELSHESYVLDFIAADWPDAVRRALQPHSAAICYAVNDAAEHRTLRDGSVELLRWAAQRQLPVVVVSNALSGAVHRDFLAAAKLTEFLTAELYSDELGIRKPNPHLLIQGAQAAGVPVSECWYVGDHLDRDVLCGTRAGIGVNVLMDDPAKSERPFSVPVTEDLAVADPAELLTILQSLWSDRPSLTSVEV